MSPEQAQALLDAMTPEQRERFAELAHRATPLIRRICEAVEDYTQSGVDAAELYANHKDQP